MTTNHDPMPLDPQLLERARRWALEEPDAQHAATLTAELEAAEGGDPAAADAVRSRFSGPLTFGTAGLRAEEGPGESRMNRLVVRRAAAGIARYLTDTLGEDDAAASVVIGYDARRGSASFARDSAGVFTAAGAAANSTALENRFKLARKYSNALAELQQAVSDPVECLTGETLAAVALLGIYEVGISFHLGNVSYSS